MRRFLLLPASLLSLIVAGIACSSSSANKPKPADSGASDAEVDADATMEDTSIPDVGPPDVIVDPMNCVPPTATNNSLGIGGYCSPAAGQCAVVGLGGKVTICTADLAGTPAHGWFCTAPCSTSADCGAGSACLATSMGQQCVPTACEALFPEAGVPVIVDAAADSGAEGGGPADAASEGAAAGDAAEGG